MLYKKRVAVADRPAPACDMRCTSRKDLFEKDDSTVSSG